MLDILRILQKGRKKVVGLMSGTSVDGIDACLAEISRNGLSTKARILDYETYPYDERTRDAILEASEDNTGTVDKICRLNFFLGRLFANSVKSIAKKSGIPLTEVDLIGSHGQTIHHLPICSEEQAISGNIAHNTLFFGSTLQIGEPAVIAQETGITTVADFRPRDMAAGGQGAPLVSYADFILFRDKEKCRILLNIGGIANVTFLPPHCTINDVIAFDTGPGNVIIDRITQIITDNASRFDENGHLAAGGKIDNNLLMKLMEHPYLFKPLPKTTGREEFGRHFADTVFSDAIASGIKSVDVLTTVTAFTAQSIAKGIEQWITPHHEVSEIIISGGGLHNKTLMHFLAEYLVPTIKIHPIDNFGIPADAKESLAFAILANEAISGNANNAPHTTGAKEPVIMGKIVPG